MEIKGENYQINYAAETATIVFKGSLRLNGANEYGPLSEMLCQAMEIHPRLALDLRELSFLNSSGVNMLSKFVIAARRKNNIQLVIHGSASIAWQEKSLHNLQRLLPSLVLLLE
jgi:hypothetical protein